MKNSQHTPEGILIHDWERLQMLAEQYVQRIENDNKLFPPEEIRKKILAYLNVLISKYGNLPSLLASKADYFLSPKKSAEVLEKAFRLAKKNADCRNITFICSSLAELYIEDLANEERGKVWLKNFENALQDYFDSSEKKKYKELYKKVYL